MATNSSIGYYAHHHGRGHLMRALAIIRHIPNRVVLLGSFGKLRDELPPNVIYEELIDDMVLGYTVDDEKPFLYTPRSEHVQARYSQILQAIRTHNISHMHVDVSPEIVSFSKLMGLSCSTIVMQGLRSDPAHTLQYAVADMIMCPARAGYIDLDNYHIAKPIEYTGGIARFDPHGYDRDIDREHLGWGAGTHVLCTTSYGGETKSLKSYITAALLEPDYTWHIIGNVSSDTVVPPNCKVYRSVNDPSRMLSAADYVIGSGGYNSIMEAAAFGKKYACMPEQRPYDEQYKAADALSRLNMALNLPAMPDTHVSLKDMFEEMDQLDVGAFAKLTDVEAPISAALAIHRAATI